MGLVSSDSPITQERAVALYEFTRELRLPQPEKPPIVEAG